jgi:nucleoside-diphosphate-sugar epimerase
MEDMSKVVQIIGVTGFIGQNLFHALAQRSRPVIGTSRSENISENLPFNWSKPCEGGGVCVASGVGAVVFCAGLAHINKPSVAQFNAFKGVNVDLALQYARAAIAARARRFLYVSSIGVHGERTIEPYNENSAFNPVDEYSRSKALAETQLEAVFRGTQTELTIIRPPMVYGANAPGNFTRLLSLVRKGLPLPLGGLNNPRSFISVQNLVSFLVECIDHSDAGGKIFTVSDNDDTTTSEFVREIARADGRSVMLLPVPEFIFVAGLSVLGHRRAALKMTAPLVVDCSYAMRVLGWHPPYSLRESLRLSS